MTRDPATAIAGVGTSALTREPAAAVELAIDAIEAACEDAGVAISDLDGLLINRSPVATTPTIGLSLQRSLGLAELSLLTVVEAEGSSACQMVQYASLAIAAGLATRVACVFADAPLAGAGAAEAFSFAIGVTEVPGLDEAVGLWGAAAPYALGARRYLDRHGLGEQHLWGVVNAAREWAKENPLAQRREPLSFDAHQESPYVAEPLRVADCAVPVNGAVAVLVTSAADARDLRQVPVYVQGMAQGHRPQPLDGSDDFGVRSGATVAAKRLFDAAGIGPEQVDLREIYDPFSSVTLTSLEEYGFCSVGEAGELAAAGELGPGGRLPTNTGGGQIAGFYLQGMTPLYEGVVQARGTAGARQVTKSDVVLVAGHGGLLERHAAVLLSRHERIEAI